MEEMRAYFSWKLSEETTWATMMYTDHVKTELKARTGLM